VLRDFYMSVRPWGLWGPIREAAREKDPSFEHNENVGRDALNVIVGVAWQTALFVIPVALLFYEYAILAGAVAVCAAATVFLKTNWYDTLAKDKSSDAARVRAKQLAEEAKIGVEAGAVPSESP